MTHHPFALALASVVAVSAVSACGDGSDIVCDDIGVDAPNLECVIGQPCGVSFDLGDADTIEVSDGALPGGITLNSDGFDGALTAVGVSRFQLTITSNTLTDNEDGVSCEPFTNTFDVIITGREPECVDRTDCLVLNAGSFTTERECVSSNDCREEFDSCVPYLDYGLCVASSQCQGGLIQISLTNVEGEEVFACTFGNVDCDGGVCTSG